MKKTRNLFLIESCKNNFNELLLNEIQFKGLTVFSSAKLSSHAILNVFEENRSVLCINCQIPSEYERIAIRIVCEDLLSTEHSISEQFERLALQHNCDIGDHKSNSSGISGTPTIHDCAYCNYLKGISLYSQEIVYRSENFFVYPTIGQFIKGYLLIIPCKHVMSCAELDELLFKEFLEVLEDVTYLIKKTFQVSQILIWENGTGNGGIGKAIDSVVHAHVHLAPSNLTTSKIKEISQFPFEKIASDELAQYAGSSYLLLKESTNNIWEISTAPIYIPRQYIRQLLAEEHHIKGELWNWRQYLHSENISQTSNSILSFLHDNWNSLPARIQKNTKEYVFK